MSTRTRTVLFTDLADYTARVARSDREGLRQILREHEEMVRPLVEQHHGRVVKNIGDSFLCLFPAATDALRASLAITDQSLTLALPGIRLGIATGDVEEIDGDAFGGPVNLASRILGVAPAGEAWFSEATRACMNEAEIPWESVGRFRLKGVPGEPECFRLVPRYRAWLPLSVSSAAKTGKLVRMARGGRIPVIPPGGVILFEGFTLRSTELEQAIRALPVLDPGNLYVAAYTVPGGDRQDWLGQGHNLVVGTPEAIEEALLELLNRAVGGTTRAWGSDDATTQLLDLRRQVDLNLVLCGLALPAVPLAEVVAGYSFDLLRDGNWVPRTDNPVVRVEVQGGVATLTALVEGVSVDGTVARTGLAIPLKDGVEAKTPVGALRFLAADGPYLGVLLGGADIWMGVMNGQTAELGRKPNAPGLAYPSREGQDNLRWLSGPRAARAQSSGFNLDRYLTGRRQAAIRLAGNSIHLEPLHEDCPTYLLRRDGIQIVKDAVRVTFGDMVVAGTTVVELRAPE